MFGVICSCACDENFFGTACEHETPTPLKHPCDKDSDCNSLGQYCYLDLNECDCDFSTGFVEDVFNPSETFGECVGPIRPCTEDSDCLYGQGLGSESLF